jgi:retinol dehydrogenase 12
VAEGIEGKVCVVTGATSGIGLETAVQLAGLGARLLLVGRDPQRGAAALARVCDAGGADALFIAADLAVQAEVRRLAGAIRDRSDHVDVLLNNAGVLTSHRALTADGIDSMLAINHLAPFLLTNLLRDLLLANAAARVITVSSSVHRLGRIVPAQFEGTRQFPAGWRGYANTKLANILFTRELARRLSETRVTANALHPGLIPGTGLFRALPPPLPAALRLIARVPAGPFVTDVAEGARTSVFLAASPAVEGVSGEYFARCRIAPCSRAARDAERARFLWQLSAWLTGLTEPAIGP